MHHEVLLSAVDVSQKALPVDITLRCCGPSQSPFSKLILSPKINTEVYLKTLKAFNGTQEPVFSWLFSKLFLILAILPLKQK